ncbi:RCC1 domain-containing protein [Cohnella fermenti]|uniref:RCC1-like domain-containing protein n=1 Tax=Cohnella fermenti TaxID=2565925 RepID=A0A4S4BKR8_9BACL|nr:hypothetical protein [Cohnella fermenti]THF74390.1 hypothetical protein E6C55_25440 [Cohnella fermenti]
MRYKLMVCVFLLFVVSSSTALAVGPTYIQACGGSHFALALKSDGTVWSWGSNAEGQLGFDSGGSNVAYPVRIQSLDQITEIACGLQSGYALQQDGSVWAWGRGAEGQLGLGNMNQINEPSLLSLTGVVKIEAGNDYVLMLLHDGRLWATGRNNRGQLGDGTTTDKASPVQVSELSHVTTTAAGGAHNLAVTADGRVYAWGSNSYGGIGNGEAGPPVTIPYLQSDLTQIISVSAGIDSSFALDNAGTLWCWGVNTYGQLGLGDTDRRYQPTLLPLENVASVSAGHDFSFARLTNGQLWGWGSNWSGKLGDGSGTDRHAPVRLQLAEVLFVGGTKGDFFMAGTDSGLYSWGNGASSVLGNGGGSRDVPGLVGGPLLATYSPAYFSPVTLPATLQTSASILVHLTDLRGYNAGWTLNISATPFSLTRLDPTTGYTHLTVNFPASCLTLSETEPLLVLNGMVADPVHGPKMLRSEQTLGAAPVPVIQAQPGFGTGMYQTRLQLRLAVPLTVQVIQVESGSRYTPGDTVGLLTGIYTSTLQLTMISGL